MSILAVYAGAFLFGGAVSAGMGVWVARMDGAEARSTFLTYVAANVLWALVAAAGLFVAGAAANELALYVSTLLSLTTVFLFTRFAFVYTGHDASLRDPVYAVLAGSYVAVLGLVVTNPIHSANWATVTHRTRPFAYAMPTEGGLGVVPDAWSFLVLAVALYYFVELFVKSRHRSSLSVVLLIVGVVGSASPVVLSELGVTAVEGFNPAPLGIPLFVVPAAYAVFGLGMMDLPPIARDNLMDQLRDPVLVLDDERHLLDYNAASEALSPALRDGDPVGRDAATLLPAVFDAVSLPTDPGATTTERVTLTDSGSYTHYSVLVSPVVEADRIVAYAMMLRDVTDLESYRRELERTNEQLDRFASVVSHDLRNPLNVASGYTESLRSDVERADIDGEPDADALADSVSEIETSHERMRTIIADLRTLADQGESVADPDPLSIGAVAEAAWRNVDTREATLVVETDGRVYADRSRLTSVFENLFRNSLDHGPDDVTVSVGLSDDGFFVADDGPGIPPDEREDVFEYGYTTSAAGTGLGLSIVEMMADSHGWTVSLDTAVGEGTSVRFGDVVVDGDDGESTPPPEPPATPSR